MGVFIFKLPSVCLSYFNLFLSKRFVWVVNVKCGILPLPKSPIRVSKLTASPSQYQFGAEDRVNIEDKPSPNK